MPIPGVAPKAPFGVKTWQEPTTARLRDKEMCRWFQHFYGALQRRWDLFRC
jgi:hypothetical protein